MAKADKVGAAMDKGTPIGIVLGFACICIAILHDGSLYSFIDLPGALVVFGGSFSGLFIMFPMKKVLSIFGILRHVFLESLPNPEEEIKRIGELATLARRDGLLALEKQLPEIKDRFLVKGLEMVIDGTPKEKIEEILMIKLHYIQERHTLGKRMFDQLSASLPAFGMVGTLIGLIQMLNSLDDPSKIGSGIAVAMVTTFYGVFGANLVYLPMAGKLDARNKEETLLRELMIQGLLALVDGEAPRTIETKLRVFLTPKKEPEEAE
jgi:chemotaxis protein MotA